MNGRLDVRVVRRAARLVLSLDGTPRAPAPAARKRSRGGERDLAFPERRCPDEGWSAAARGTCTDDDASKARHARDHSSGRDQQAGLTLRRGVARDGIVARRVRIVRSAPGGTGRHGSAGSGTLRCEPGHEGTGQGRKAAPESTRGGTSRLTGRVGGRREIPPRLSTHTGRGSERRRVAESLGTGRPDPMGTARQRQPSLPASPAASIALATRPEFCRIAASIADTISGCSFKKLRAFSRPWPMRWPS